jgi:hypothetical protein
MSEDDLQLLKHMRPGSVHWTEIGTREQVDRLHWLGLLHRSQAGRYYQTADGQAAVYEPTWQFI